MACESCGCEWDGYCPKPEAKSQPEPSSPSVAQELNKWLQHTRGCNAAIAPDHYAGREVSECDCGLDLMLAALAPTQPPVAFVQPPIEGNPSCHVCGEPMKRYFRCGKCQATTEPTQPQPSAALPYIAADGTQYGHWPGLPGAAVEFSDKRCSRCGAKRLTSGVCSLIPNADGTGGCPDPTYDYYAEKYPKIMAPSSPPEELARRIAEARIGGLREAAHIAQKEQCGWTGVDDALDGIWRNGFSMARAQIAAAIELAAQRKP